MRIDKAMEVKMSNDDLALKKGRLLKNYKSVIDSELKRKICSLSFSERELDFIQKQLSKALVEYDAKILRKKEERERRKMAKKNVGIY